MTSTPATTTSALRPTLEWKVLRKVALSGLDASVRNTQKGFLLVRRACLARGLSSQHGDHRDHGAIIMTTVPMWEKIDQQRRRLFGAAAMTVAAAQFGVIGSANSQPGKAKLPVIKPGTHTSFGPLKQIDAGALNVGYAEAGPADGPPVILLHGWPYDIYSFVDVTPALASAGYRVIVPFLRGYGTTRFLSADAFRNGQPSGI